MAKLSVLFLLLIFGAIKSKAAKDEDSSIIPHFEISGEIIEDLFHIYTGIALSEREFIDKPVDFENVKLFLYTKENRDRYILLDNEDPIELELEDPDAKIVFIIHGWLEYKGVPWYDELKDAFLNREENYYVIQVDWSEYSWLGYILSSYSTRDVGNHLAQFIVNLNENYEIPLSNILVVGHSLGGQIAGYVGKKIQELTEQKLPRLVALDPAGPLFMGREEHDRLNPTDAHVVHVIHTNGGALGFLSDTGTIDFYPNGGTWQPGCDKLFIPSWGDINDIVPLMCDHQRSWKFFIEAINDAENFLARKCPNLEAFQEGKDCEDVVVTLGNLESQHTGAFYLETSHEAPFGTKNAKVEL